MSTPPYVPIFVTDYLGDTTELSTEEHGAYFLLILTCWKQEDCSLPDDDRKLARICRLSTRKWKQIRETMEDYWTIENGRWTNERLQKEWAYVKNRSNSAREAANARWNSQDTENKGSGSCDGNADAYAGAYANADAPQPQPQIEEPDGSSSPPTPSPKLLTGKDWPEIPDWVPVEPWNGFIEMRRRKSANPTPRAVELLLKKLTGLRDDGGDPGAILDQSTTKNWTDIYPLKDDRHGTAKSKPDRRDGLDRAIDRRLAHPG